MTRKHTNLLCQVMAKCSNRWSHLVSSSPSPQSSSFCKIVQKWRKSISYNCLVAVSFEYKNYGSGYNAEGASVTLKLLSFLHHGSPRNCTIVRTCARVSVFVFSLYPSATMASHIPRVRCISSRKWSRALW